MLDSLALWLALAVPSLSIVQKYTGWTGMFVYLAMAGVAVALRSRIPVPASRAARAAAAAATFAILLAIFLAVYPRVNVHTPGMGSDDDDAHDLGAIALLHGTSPYAERTYLGNRLHQLPGAFVLAAPFVLLGTSALQNLFWLSMFFLLVARATRDDAAALRLAWLVLVGSPTVLHQVVTGTTYLSNTIYVLLGLWWIGRREGRGGRTHSWRDLAAVAWGIALASRANFLFLVPLAFGSLWRREGLAAAVRTAAIVLASFALLTVPFYVARPMDFGPLEAANRLTRFDAQSPHASMAIIAAMAVLACWLALRPISSLGVLFLSSAAVQAVPVVAGVAIGWWQLGRPDLAYASYGTFFAWFTFASVGLRYSAKTRVGPASLGQRRPLSGFVSRMPQASPFR
jgi:hypothetical protein